MSYRASCSYAWDLASAVVGATILVDCGLTSGNIVMARELTLQDH